MKHLKHLKHMLATCNIHIYFCNIQIKHLHIRLEQMKHLEHTPETYVYSHYNMCNIPIYFCNIDILHLHHTSETLETYSFNMIF
jgi:hypothetical protein